MHVAHRRLFPRTSALCTTARSPTVGVLIAFVVSTSCSGPQRHPQQPVAAQEPPLPAPAIDPAVEIELARLARAQGRTDDASRHLELAITAAPSVASPQLDLAELLLEEGTDLERATALVDEADRLGAPGSRAPRLRGWIAELRGDDAAAVVAYAQVLAVATDTDVRLRRGLLLQRLARWREAAEEVSRVLVERPNDRAAHAALAEIHEAEGRLGPAEGELLKLASLAPAEAVPQRKLAAFYRRHGDAEKARVADARARSLDSPPRALRPLRPSRR